eukprot:349801-Chlamydomonas_euryale.AAC.37
MDAAQIGKTSMPPALWKIIDPAKSFLNQKINDGGPRDTVVITYSSMMQDSLRAHVKLSHQHAQVKARLLSLAMAEFYHVCFCPELTCCKRGNSWQQCTGFSNQVDAGPRSRHGQADVFKHQIAPVALMKPNTISRGGLKLPGQQDKLKRNVDKKA